MEGIIWNVYVTKEFLVVICILFSYNSFKYAVKRRYTLVF